MIFDALGWFALGQIDLEGAVPENEERAWPLITNAYYAEQMRLQKLIDDERDDEEIILAIYA